MVATVYKIAQGRDIALQSHIWHMRSYCEHIVNYVYMSLVTSVNWSWEDHHGPDVMIECAARVDSMQHLTMGMSSAPDDWYSQFSTHLVSSDSSIHESSCLWSAHAQMIPMICSCPDDPHDLPMPLSRFWGQRWLCHECKAILNDLSSLLDHIHSHDCKEFTEGMSWLQSAYRGLQQVQPVYKRLSMTAERLQRVFDDCRAVTEDRSKCCQPTGGARSPDHCFPPLPG